MDEKTVKELSLLHDQVCDALGAPARLMIFYALKNGPRYVNDLAAELDMPQPTVSRHLKILRERALVTAQRDGPAVYYSLSDPRIIDALDLLRSVMRDRLLRQSQVAEIELPDGQNPDRESSH